MADAPKRNFTIGSRAWPMAHARSVPSDAPVSVVVAPFDNGPPQHQIIVIMDPGVRLAPERPAPATLQGDATNRRRAERPAGRLRRRARLSSRTGRGSEPRRSAYEPETDPK